MLNESTKNFYEFDSFQVDARRRLLFREGRPVRVTPKAFDILLGLVRSGGRVVSKDELMTTIWPNCFVEEGNLAQNIFLLRRVLGERKNEHKYIITIPGVGYRFAPYVRESAVSPTIRKVGPTRCPKDYLYRGATVQIHFSKRDGSLFRNRNGGRAYHEALQSEVRQGYAYIDDTQTRRAHSDSVARGERPGDRRST